MKVIFVSSGNKAVGCVSAFVRSQFESLRASGLEMILFPVVGKGVKGYAGAVLSLRRLVLKEKPDIIHAHYSTCGYVAVLASIFCKCRIVVSILGSFPFRTVKLHVVRFFIKHVWDRTLVKSSRTAGQLGIDLPVIPNGVNLSQFTLMDTSLARAACGFDSSKRYVIWCSEPSRPEKRYFLAQRAVELLKDDSVVLFPVFGKPHAEVVKYMCAADVLLLTSANEGSPNVIKEAMACNCPIVSTDVGDVRERIEGLGGCFVIDCEPVREDPSVEAPLIAGCLDRALSFGGRTSGRERLIEDGLTLQQVACRITELYRSAVE